MVFEAVSRRFQHSTLRAVVQLRAGGGIMVQNRKSSGQKTKSSAALAGSKKSAPGATPIEGVPATVSVAGSSLQLSAGEVNILAVFRKYLMTPGRMLCLNNTDIGSMKRSLDRLTAAGLLIPEDFKGSYSLTRSGFNAMNELN